MDNQEPAWQINEHKGGHDPLLKCLMAVVKLHNKSFSEQALTAGLPLENQQLTPELFIRAAKRAGLAAHISKTPLRKINNLMLPAVLLLRGREACVLVEAHKEGGWQIIQADPAQGGKRIDTAQLEACYNGYAIFVCPEYEFNQRKESFFDRKERGHWFWSVIIKAWSIYSEVLIGSFLINVFALAMPFFVMQVYDRVVPNSAVYTLWVLAIGIIIILSFDCVMRILRSYFIDRAAKFIDVHLSADVFAQLLGLRMEVRPKSVGALVNTVSSFEAFRDFIASASVNVLVDLPFALLFLIVMWNIGGTVVLVPMITIPIILIISLLIQKKVNARIEALYLCSAERQAALIESLGNAETIKMLSAEGNVQYRWELLLKKIAKLGSDVRFLSNITSNVSLYIQFLTNIGIVIVGVYQIAHGHLTMGGLIACVILSGRALAPMVQVAGVIAQYHQSKISLEVLGRIMEAPVDREKKRNYLHRPTLKGEIEFDNVCFNYPDEMVYAIHGCSFKIRQGEKVGIIGRMGSGKSTISRLIAGLYQPISGSILIDGTEVQQIDPADLRRNMGYVPQEIVLFDGSIRDNIVYSAPYVDDVAILKAAKMSAVDTMASAHPDGFNRKVGERGLALSGGQKQAIGVARALLLDPPILILDEPTSAMDDRSELQFKNNLEKYYKDRTIVLITHKASVLSLVDRIIILDHGKLVADGPREHVLEALAQAKIQVR
jgi:ATP-binding cassette, subfamily C, bacterial LapB